MQGNKIGIFLRALLFALHLGLYCGISSCDLLVNPEDFDTCFRKSIQKSRFGLRLLFSLAARYCFDKDLLFVVGCVQRGRFECFGIMILARFCTGFYLDLLGDTGMVWLASSPWLPCLLAGRTCTACLAAWPAWPACSAGRAALLVLPALPAMCFFLAPSGEGRGEGIVFGHLLPPSSAPSGAGGGESR